MEKKEFLPPGFRFHPTDVELLKYYLKRKILGRPYFKAIQEVNIYEHDPSELSSLSCLKISDRIWYFFCPKERRYGRGDRAKRSTRGGFWKTTGQDRSVLDNDEPVGMIKTLIFHEGRASNGSRTDWVMHEYSLKDPDLAAQGIPQDTYVVCAIFKKDGPGPRNGAQYGAPFKEQEWEDDGISFRLSSDLLIAARGSVQAPLQEEQRDHFVRNQDEGNNDLTESIAVIGSPPPVPAASETVLPELSGPPTAVINHANDATMEDAANDTNVDGMDFDEFLDLISTSSENDNSQETQTAARDLDETQTGPANPAETQTATAGHDVCSPLAATAAEENGIFAGFPLQEEQRDHFTRNQDEANNDLSKSIAVVGSPPPVLMASETGLPEPPAPVLSTPAVINRANDATMEDVANDTNLDGMELDEFLDLISTSSENDNSQETQVAAAGSNETQTAPDGPGETQTAEDNGIFAGLPPLDVKLDEILDSGNGVGFDSHFPLSTDGYMELFDLGQHFTDVPTFVGSLQGEIDMGNVGN